MWLKMWCVLFHLNFLFPPSWNFLSHTKTQSRYYISFRILFHISPNHVLNMDRYVAYQIRSTTKRIKTNPIHLWWKQEPTNKKKKKKPVFSGACARPLSAWRGRRPCRSGGGGSWGARLRISISSTLLPTASSDPAGSSFLSTSPFFKSKFLLLRVLWSGVFQSLKLFQTLDQILVFFFF